MNTAYLPWTAPATADPAPEIIDPRPRRKILLFLLWFCGPIEISPLAPGTLAARIAKFTGPAELHIGRLSYKHQRNIFIKCIIKYWRFGSGGEARSDMKPTNGWLRPIPPRNRTRYMGRNGLILGDIRLCHHSKCAFSTLQLEWTLVRLCRRTIKFFFLTFSGRRTTFPSALLTLLLLPPYRWAQLDELPDLQTSLKSCSSSSGEQPKISQPAAGVISEMAPSEPHCMICVCIGKILSSHTA